MICNYNVFAPTSSELNLLERFEVGSMELRKNIDILESSIQNPLKGLPEEVFLFVGRITPLINVDLLIKNEQSHTLPTWRDDGFYPTGWHVPGGIIRYKETSAERVDV